jgi:hypothetical protein
MTRWTSQTKTVAVGFLLAIEQLNRFGILYRESVDLNDAKWIFAIWPEMASLDGEVEKRPGDLQYKFDPFVPETAFCRPWMTVRSDFQSSQVPHKCFGMKVSKM